MPDQVLVKSLQKAGLLEDPATATFTALTGGVASEIWKAETGGKKYCIKRALPKLKVEADWFAPVERNRFEVAWCEIAAAIVPE